MSLINISGIDSIYDTDYRYKMPAVITKNEGKGNGKKTVIINCNDISKALHRSMQEICKYLGYVLCTQSKYTQDPDRVIINGEFTSQTIQQHIHEYVETFVLCPICSLPETKYRFKSKTVSHKCHACGNIELISEQHKLTHFIIKEHVKIRKLLKKISSKKTC